MVKRYHNKIKEGHIYRACSVIQTPLTSSAAFCLLHCSVTFLSSIAHTSTVSLLLSHSHTSYDHLYYLIQPSPSLNILPIIQLSVKHTRILLQNAQPHTHSNTGVHTVGSCLSEAVAVGLWSCQAGVVGTVPVLERDTQTEQWRTGLDCNLLGVCKMTPWSRTSSQSLHI